MLVGAGRLTQATADAHTSSASGATFDMDSSGYEFTLTANPTKHWRVQANYSYTDTHLTNFGPEVAAWMTREIAYYSKPIVWQADVLAGYQLPKTGWPAAGALLHGLTLQLNVNNVFNDSEWPVIWANRRR